VENPKLYPSPVVTRWNTWFNAVKYINENFANLILKQFEFVASKCDNFKFVLLKFENQDFNTTNVYSVIFDLCFWLESQLEIYQNSETFQHDFGKKLFSDAKSKLGKYFLDGAQPATKLFKKARVFDPLQNYLSRKLDDFSFPEFIKSQIKDEWLLYLEISSELNKQSLDNLKLEKWPLRKRIKFLNKFSGENQKTDQDSDSLCENNFLFQILSSWSTTISSFFFAGNILETYLFGSRIFFNTLSVCIGYILAILFQPYLYELKKHINSPYEYLETRYHHGNILRWLCTCTGGVFNFAFLTLHLWGSAIILSILIPMPLWLSSVLIGFLSMVMGSFNGFKQFLCVNFLQVIFVLVTLIIAISLDLLLNDHGTAPVLLEIAGNYSRLKIIETKFDFRTKYTIWNQVFSSPISWCAFHCLLPSNFKKLRSASTSLKSKILIASNAPLVILINFLLVFSGVMTFVHFYGCDPLLIMRFDDKNQIAPFWLMQALETHAPFLTGITFSSFILSSIYQHSNGIANLRNSIYDELIKPVFTFDQVMVERVKLSTFFLLNIMSIVCAMLFTYARNSLLSLFFLFNHSLNPPIFGVMLLSILNTKANFFGAATTFIISLIASIWLAIARIYYINYSRPEFEPNTSLCENSTFTRMNLNNDFEENEIFSYYSVSSLWYPLLSSSFIIIFGSILSFLYEFVKIKYYNYVNKPKLNYVVFNF
ncbi:unnamed protein product, partial [Brachionus calyciflorus]